MSRHLRKIFALLKSGSSKSSIPEVSPSLASFLQTTKEKYLSDVRATPSKGAEWTVVMGNEAGDLDSVASSIAYAWVSSVIRKTPSVPLIQIARDDLNLRAENLYALKLAGVTDFAAQLLSVTDIEELAQTPFPSHTFALVDHNRLAGTFSQGNSEAKVVAIVDHHADENLYKDSADPRTIAPAGSCASHVANLLHTREKDADIAVPRELATLLLSAILIDTDGLRPGGKAVQADHDAAAFLIPRSSLAGPGLESLSTQSDSTSAAATAAGSSTDPAAFSSIPEVKQLANDLALAKFDVSRLSAWDLLRRDYKEYTYKLPWLPAVPTIKAGLATVPVRLQDWGSDGTLEKEAQRWMERQGLSVLGVLTSFRDAGKLGTSGKGKHKREQAWFVRDGTGGAADQEGKLELDEVASRLWKGLEANEELDLKEHKMDSTVEAHPAIRIRVYKQGNANATRKATAPLLKSILESL